MNVVLERDCICANCRGVVNVPTQVKWNPSLKIYQPSARCAGCGAIYTWRSSKNPVKGQHVGYNGMVDTWFADKPLRGPQPKVVEDA